MGELLIFKDIADSLMKNPRDVTLFGERNLIEAGKSSYDVYYYCAEGARHNKNLDSIYVPLPIFSNSSYQDCHENLLKLIAGYHAEYKNNYAGSCSPEELNFYRITQIKQGAIGNRIFPWFMEKQKLLDKVTREQGEEPAQRFTQEIDRRIKEIRNHIQPLL